MVESGRVPAKGRISASIERMSRRIAEKGRIYVSTENGRIRDSTGKKENPCEYRKTVPTSIEKGSNLCEYRKMEEYGRVPGKSRIRASIEKLSWRVLKKGRICVTTEKW